MNRREKLELFGVRRAGSGVKFPNARCSALMVRRLPSTPDAELRTPHARTQGAGFSLIEILVVMGLIAFLTAAIVVILPRVANTSKIAATRATIKKVDELLNDRINGFQRWIGKQDQTAGNNGVPAYIPLWAASRPYSVGAVIGSPANGQAYLCTAAGTSGTGPPIFPVGIGSTVNDNGIFWTNASVALAKILTVKQLFWQNFPQTYSELQLPSWQSNTAYTVGSLIHAVSPASPNLILTFRCTAAGQSGGTAPTWPTVPASPGPTMSDNKVTWQLIPFNTGGSTQWTGRTTESAASLYITLTQGKIFDTEPPAASDLKGIEVADTDGGSNNPGDGLMEVVDAWGNPLRFYRWPTRLIRTSMDPTASQTLTSGAYGLLIQPTYPPASPNSGLSANLLVSSLVVPPAASTPPSTTASEISTPVYSDLAKDPDDPFGLIQAALTQMSSFVPNFESNSNLSAASQPQYLHTPDTYWTPLIVSMGSDGQLGLYEPCDTPNQPYLAPPTPIPASTYHGYLCQPKVDVSLTDPSGLNALFDNITNHQ